jgi:protein involved in polysaccharide export with SLBB domain
VFVSGEVRAPGKILMSGNSMTLLEALAQAGSPTQSASNEITVTRRDEAADSAEPTVIRVNRRDLEVRGRLGAEARRTAVRRFDRARLAIEIIPVYERVVPWRQCA